MGFIDDYVNAIRTYPDAAVTLAIIDVELPGDALNVGEEARFQVQVTNEGELDMEDVVLKVRGLGGTLVQDGGAAHPWVTEFVTGEGQIDRIRARGGVQATSGSSLGLRAPSSPQEARDLVEVTLEGWNASVRHLHSAHSRASSAVRATYHDRVRDQ